MGSEAKLQVTISSPHQGASHVSNLLDFPKCLFEPKKCRILLPYMHKRANHAEASLQFPIGRKMLLNEVHKSDDFPCSEEWCPIDSVT